jgi:hypothetical protein
MKVYLILYTDRGLPLPLGPGGSSHTVTISRLRRDSPLLRVKWHVNSRVNG